MKIALFLNKDLEANLSYNLLKKDLLKHTVRIYYSQTVGNSKLKPSELLTLEYFEKAFIFKDLTAYLKEHKLPCSFEFFDENFKSFPIERCDGVNSPAFINKIKAFEPDLFISIRFGKIFKDEIIQVPKHGLINLHSGVLPDYRGILGTLHAINDGKNKVGCTLHTIPDSGIDTGEIIDIAELAVHPEKSLFWHVVQLYPLGVELIIKALKVIEKGLPLEAKKQNLQEGNYFSVPTKTDFEQLKNIGINIISREDIEEVLSTFILNEMTEKEKHQLSIYINHTTYTTQ